ncbi:hypothetical protein ColTof4_09073 [Colletotrichum tofieldiae]|nr:hypothetical protein ColTof4_09073 [Colletotrichum tofieldiae]
MQRIMLPTLLPSSKDGAGDVVEQRMEPAINIDDREWKHGANDASHFLCGPFLRGYYGVYLHHSAVLKTKTIVAPWKRSVGE